MAKTVVYMKLVDLRNHLDNILRFCDDNPALSMVKLDIITIRKIEDVLKAGTKKA